MLQHLTDHAELRVWMVRRRRWAVLVVVAVMRMVRFRAVLDRSGIRRQPMFMRELMNDADGDLRQHGQQRNAQAESKAAAS
jgi:hypothetical protein